MDLDLPDGSGLDLVSELRSKTNLQNTPIIAVTADALPSTKTRAKEAGFNDLITKPIDISLFLKLVRVYLKKRKDKNVDNLNQDMKKVS